MSEPFVVAGGIVRNRAWILPRHLVAVAFNSPGAMFYVTGDNTDNTEDFFTHELEYRRDSTGDRFTGLVDRKGGPPPKRFLKSELDYLRHDTGEPGYTRDGSDGPRYNSKHMAAERNLWLHEAIKQWPQMTHVWVVDSDVLPEPDVLEKLLALKSPVAAAFVPVADGVTPIAMMGWDAEKRRAVRTGEESKLTKPHVATMVGGSYLLDVSDKWILFSSYWGEHEQGEDGYMAEAFRRATIPMLHHPGARCQHIMQREE